MTATRKRRRWIGAALAAGVVAVTLTGCAPGSYVWAWAKAQPAVESVSLDWEGECVGECASYLTAVLKPDVSDADVLEFARAAATRTEELNSNFEGASRAVQASLTVVVRGNEFDIEDSVAETEQNIDRAHAMRRDDRVQRLSVTSMSTGIIAEPDQQKAVFLDYIQKDVLAHRQTAVSNPGSKYLAYGAGQYSSDIRRDCSPSSAVIGSARSVIDTTPGLNGARIYWCDSIRLTVSTDQALEAAKIPLSTPRQDLSMYEVQVYVAESPEDSFGLRPSWVAPRWTPPIP